MSVTRTVPALVLALACATPARGVAAETAPPVEPAECAAPPEVFQDYPLLPRTAVRLSEGGTLRIVVLGGASTAGTRVGGPRNAYPAQLRRILAARYPKNRIVVVNLSRPHQTAEQQVQRIAREVIPQLPTLVIWETGTYDAVRGIDLDEFSAALESGIAELKARNVDVLLVDMQYARGSEVVLDVEGYQQRLDHIADLEDVRVFHRYALMRHWADAGVFDYTARDRQGYAELAARVFLCLAFRMADSIEQGSR